MLNWESLQTACLSCTSCPLSQTRHNVVFGVGPQDAEVMFVGEGPGENEDLQGEPFVGAAGKFLDEMLSIIDLGRENCYITNIVKCRPPRNRDPMQTEQDACIGFLRAQTKLIQPKIIVCLGRIAAMRLIRPDFKISCEHGQFTEKGGILFTALYHPSALLRDETKRPGHLFRSQGPPIQSPRGLHKNLITAKGRAAGRVLPALRRGSAQGFPSGNWLRSEAEQTDEGRQQPRFASDYQNFVHIIHLK